MKKNAFSYIELIFAMVIVVALMAMSGPFLTHKAKKEPTVLQGEYECWRIDDEDGTAKYCQHQKTEYDEEFDTATCASSCQFFKQSNVTKYSITLYGAGGGGSKFQMYDELYKKFSYEVNTSPIEKNELSASGSVKCEDISSATYPNLLINSKTIFTSDDIKSAINKKPYSECEYSRNGATYTFDIIKFSVYADQIKFKRAQNGYPGSHETFELSLESMPFTNDAITIDSSSSVVKLGKGGTGENNTGAHQGATAGGATTFTAVNADGKLPTAFCRGNTCTASGGAAGDASKAAEEKISIYDNKNAFLKQKIRLIVDEDGKLNEAEMKKSANISALTSKGSNREDIVSVLNNNRKYNNASTGIDNRTYEACASIREDVEQVKRTIHTCANHGGRAGEYAGITQGGYDTQYYLIGKICFKDSGCFEDEVLLKGNKTETPPQMDNYFGDGGNGVGGAIRITW